MLLILCLLCDLFGNFGLTGFGLGRVRGWRVSELSWRCFAWFLRRIAPRNDGSVGFLLSHPVAKCATGWGTLFVLLPAGQFREHSS